MNNDPAVFAKEETDAMKAIVEIVRGLTPEGRDRVIDWAQKFFECDDWDTEED
jgi:hypothetical protein